MLKLDIVELSLRTIPELAIFIWGIYVVLRKPFNIKKYIFCTIVMSILTFIVRMLPIYAGVHIIINNILTISILAIIGIPLLEAIYGTLLITFLLAISEVFNMLILSGFNIKIDYYVMSSAKRCILGIPSLIFFLISILLIKLYYKKRNINNNSFSNKKT